MSAQAPAGARMRWIWIVLAASTVLLVWQYPEQAGVLLSKLNRIALGAALGVMLDRAIFPYARPNEIDVEDGWMWRRAVLMVGGMLAAALAL